MKRYERQGLLAIEPSAFFGFFPEASVQPTVVAGSAAIVTVRGPLEHHDGWWGDSYDRIKGRVTEACQGPTEAIVLLVDSPGGEVSGCFDLARALRSMCAAAGKTLLAYVEGSACSAAYALASAAERIAASPNASIGSIGVLATRLDATAADEKWGMKFSLLTSGARKAYGSPHVPMDDNEAAETQSVVDSLAQSFFALVAEMRPGLDVDSIAALEAGVFRGKEAVSRGLVDELGSLEDLLASIASEDNRPMATEGNMDEEEKKARAALQSIVDDEKADAKAKARAKKALAAMDDEDDTSDDDEAAEGDEPEKKDEEEEASAQPAAILAIVRSELRAVEAKAAESAERTRLLATRPDLDEPTKALLATASVADVKAFVETAPRRALKPAATAVVGGTPAEGQGGDDPSDPAASDDRRAIRLGMGRLVEASVPHVKGARQVFPQMTRAAGVKWLEDRAKARAEAQAKSAS